MTQHGNSEEGGTARRGSEESAAVVEDARAARSALAGVAAPFPQLVDFRRSLLAWG
jgi:hypothetical protein